jgi:hypothetical protein
MIKTFKIFENFNNNFWKWFGDSKMVDEKGNPLILYHGVGPEGIFDEFKEEYIGTTSGNYGHYGKGFYFTYSKGGANLFSKMYGGTGEVIEVYLSIKAPFIVSQKNIIKIGQKYKLNLDKKQPVSVNLEDLSKQINNVDKISGELFDLFIKHGYENAWKILIKKNKNKIPESKIDLNFISDVFFNIKDDGYISDYNKKELKKFGIKPKIIYEYPEMSMHWLTNLGQDSEDWTNAIKKEGYDGIIAGDEIVVFKPNQIKSINNNGDYSSSNNINENNNDDYSITKLNGFKN